MSWTSGREIGKEESVLQFPGTLNEGSQFPVNMLDADETSDIEVQENMLEQFVDMDDFVNGPGSWTAAALWLAD